MNYFKYLDKYPADVIAGIVGVKPATVKRWRSLGEIPVKHKLAVRSVKDTYIPGNRERKARLYKTDPRTLAKLANVPLTTVYKWRREGDIPLDQRVFIADQFAGKVSLGKVAKSVEKYSFSQVRYHEWNPNAELTEALIGVIMLKLSKVKAINEQSLKQAGISFTSHLASNDKLLHSYGLSELAPGVFYFGFPNNGRWTYQYRDPSKVLGELADMLNHLVSYSTTLHTLIWRDRVSGGKKTGKTRQGKTKRVKVSR